MRCESLVRYWRFRANKTLMVYQSRLQPPVPAEFCCLVLSFGALTAAISTAFNWSELPSLRIKRAHSRISEQQISVGVDVLPRRAVPAQPWRSDPHFGVFETIQ